MATGNIFKKIFGIDPIVFKSVSEVDDFLNKKKLKLTVKRVHSGISSSRGSVFPIVKVNASKKFDQALNA